MVTAIGPAYVYTPALTVATPNVYATLLNGPPKSNPASSPHTAPKITLFPFPKCSITFVIPSIIPAIGAPRTYCINPMVTKEPTIGMIMIGMMELNAFGTLTFFK